MDEVDEVEAEFAEAQRVAQPPEVKRAASYEQAKGVGRQLRRLEEVRRGWEWAWRTRSWSHWRLCRRRGGSLPHEHERVFRPRGNGTVVKHT